MEGLSLPDGALVQGATLTVSGWSADREDGAPVSRVEVRLQGGAVGNAELGIERPDVVAAHGRSDWLRSGWRLEISTADFPPGDYTITAVAFDREGLSAPLSSSRTFRLAHDDPPEGQIESAVDSLTGSNVILDGSRLKVRGWAADKQSGSPVSRVEVFLDGTSLGEATLGLPRPDIAESSGRPDWTLSGWAIEADLGAFSKGTHTITAVATDAGQKQGVLSGGRPITLSALRPYLVRVIYFVPANRQPQPGYEARLQRFILDAQDWLQRKMSELGYPLPGPLPELNEQGMPVIHVLVGQQDDSYYTQSIWERVVGEVTRLYPTRVHVNLIVTETYRLEDDGTVRDAWFLGARLHMDAGGGGAAIVPSLILPFLDTSLFEADDQYDGLVIPELGPVPLSYGKTFSIEAGRTIGELASTLFGGTVHELAHTFGLQHCFLDDANRAGMLMGNGFRGIRADFVDFPNEFVTFCAGNLRTLAGTQYLQPQRVLDDRQAPAGQAVATVLRDSEGRPYLRIQVDVTDDHSGLSHGQVYLEQLHSEVAAISFEGGGSQAVEVSADTLLDRLIRWEAGQPIERRWSPGDYSGGVFLYDLQSNRVTLPFSFQVPPALVAEPDGNFGPVDVGTSKDITFTVRNVLDIPVVLSDLGMDDGRRGFSIVEMPQLPLTLSPGQTFEIVVRFAPQQLFTFREHLSGSGLLGLDLEGTGTLSGFPGNYPPQGAVESASDAFSGGSTVPQWGTLLVTGWAADVEDGAPVSRVKVLIDNVPVGEAALGFERPDIVTAFDRPDWLRSGWRLEIPLDYLPPGPHTVRAVASDSAPVEAMVDSSQSFELVPNSRPFGWVEYRMVDGLATETATQGQVVTVGGWAVDDDDGAPVGRVEIRLNGVAAGDATLGVARPDVVAVFNRSDWLNSGWEFQIDTSVLLPGDYTVTAVAYDSVGVVNALSGSQTFSVLPPP